MKSRYDLIVSLGAACSCTQALRRAGLQFASMPLDWVLCGFDRRVDLVCNGFRDFLNLEDLRSVSLPGWEARAALDARVENVRTGMLFLHDFRANIPLAAQLPDVAAKYERRISRFYRMVRTSKRVLFVWLMTPLDKPLEDVRLVAARDRLAQCFPSVSVELLNFELTAGVPLRRCKRRQVSENVSSVGFDYKTYDHPPFPNSVEEPLLVRYLRWHYAAVDYRTPEQRAENRRNRNAARYRKYGATGFWNLQWKRFLGHLGRLFR